MLFAVQEVKLSGLPERTPVLQEIRASLLPLRRSQPEGTDTTPHWCGESPDPPQPTGSLGPEPPHPHDWILLSRPAGPCGLALMPEGHHHHATHQREQRKCFFKNATRLCPWRPPRPLGDWACGSLASLGKLASEPGGPVCGPELQPLGRAVNSPPGRCSSPLGGNAPTNPGPERPLSPPGRPCPKRDTRGGVGGGPGSGFR